MKVTSNIIITSKKRIDFGEVVDYTIFRHEKNCLESIRNERAWSAFAKWCDKNKVKPNDVEMFVMENRNV